MKRNKLISCLCAAVIAYMLSFGGTACMVTGLNLPADLNWLALGCAVGSLAAAVCFSFRRGGWILVGIAVLHGLWMTVEPDFLEQLRAMGYNTIQYYIRAYGLPCPTWLVNQTASTQLLPLLMIAGLVMSAATWTILRCKRAFLAVPVALVPLASCLIVTDTVPDVAPIFLLFLGMILLMMTQSVRRRNEAQGNRLTAILVLPICAALLGLFLLVPQGDYSAPEQISSMQGLFDWFAQQMPVVDQTSEGDFVVSVGGTANQKVNLNRVGRRIPRNTPVMEVTSDYNGILYLRSRDYDIYTGVGWEASQGRTEPFCSVESFWRNSSHSASVRVIGRRGQYFLPYYPTEQQILTNGMLPNTNFNNSYSYEFCTLSSNWKDLWMLSKQNTPVPLDSYTPDARYLALPDSTRQQARSIITNLFSHLTQSSDQYIVDGINDIRKADLIESFVQSSAVYDLNPGRMPADEDDFALWFLEDSDKGYCVHFATAATVLLRAAGIPARYVEGYMVQTSNGTTIVRDRHAHAWVEYYLDHIGWVILDATPGTGEEEPPTETTEPTPTTPVTPTVPTTAPTQPTETSPTATKPSEPTPSETDQPSEPTASQLIDVPDNGTGGDTASTRVIPRWFKTLLLILAWMTAAVFLVAGQWMLRRYFKQKILRRGNTNTQALNRYREIRRLAHLCSQCPPENLTDLAQKAKFSQHTLSQEELAQFDLSLLEYTRSLHAKPWYCRVVYRLIFAAY